jgi:hypothetical protein
MNQTHVQQKEPKMFRNILFATLAALTTVSTANATVIFGLMIDPATVANTSANGVSSIRSGANTWQLYALDDSNSDSGISSYDVTLANITGNVLHRSPETNIQGIDGDFFQSGFTMLRTGPTNPIQASPPLPGTSPFLIAGFGQTAGNFTATSLAVDPQSTVVGPTVSGSWGDYLSPLVAPALWGGHHWLFLAEGNYSAGTKPSITKSTATVYVNNQNFPSGLVTMRNIIFTPEPGSVVLAGLALVGLVGFTRRRG